MRETLRATATRIAGALQEFVDTTELDFLFDRDRHLFAIGYNVTEGRRDSTYYDALASEARLASFVAIAMRHVSQEHWFKLGRLMTPVGTHRALVSWSASMFEYLMPLLVMRSYPRTLLSETYHAVITRHIEYAKAAGMPWGISESAYNMQDAGANYQYRAFGVPGLGLKRGLADDLVVAPYACLLAAPLRPKEVIANLEHLASEGALGPMGYYEAIDYTKERLEAGAAARDRAHLHGAPSRHEPGGAEQLPERQHHAGALPRRSARAGRRAAAAGTQPASGAARPSARRAQGRRDAGPGRAVARAPVRHAAHGHAARASAVERIVERHADQRRRRLHALARHRGHALARGLHVRRVGHVLLRARSHRRQRRRREPILVGRVSAERPRRRQLRGDIRAGSRDHSPTR